MLQYVFIDSSSSSEKKNNSISIFNIHACLKDVIYVLQKLVIF